jgi:hypothetical protein
LCDSLKYQTDDDPSPGKALRIVNVMVGPPQLSVPLALSSCVATFGSHVAPRK